MNRALVFKPGQAYKSKKKKVVAFAMEVLGRVKFRFIGLRQVTLHSGIGAALS